MFYNPHLRKRKFCDERQETFLQLTPRCLLVPGASGVLSIESAETPRMFYKEQQFLLDDTLKWPGVRENNEFLQVKGTIEFHSYDQVQSTVLSSEAAFLPFHLKRHVTPSGTVIHLFGRTRENVSLCVNVYGQRYYFYADAEEQILRLKISALVREMNFCDGVDYTFESVQAKPVMGYRPHKQTYTKISFMNYYQGRQVAKGLADDNIAVFESSVDPVTRLMMDRELSTFAWMRISRYRLRSMDKLSNCTVEIECETNDIDIVPEDDSWPCYTCMAIDIECLGENYTFPDPSRKDDLIIQISCICFDVKSDISESHLFTLGGCDTIPNANVYEFGSEYELLLGFLLFFRQLGPDMLTGYNINSFDCDYVVSRANMYKIDLKSFSKLRRGQFFVKRGADSFLNRAGSKVIISGLMVFDMYRVCIEKVTAVNHKLDTIARQVLHEQKEDVSYRQIPILFQRDASGRAQIGSYCIQDSRLVMKLFKKLNFHYEASEIARLANIPIRKVIFDGQQTRIYSSLLKECKRHDMIIPVPNVPEETSYQGATVFEPKIGFYSCPVAVLDFASLYPSIIQRHNLCYSTLIVDEHTVPSEHITRICVNGKEYKFVDESVHKSLLSSLLTSWLQTRKSVREQLKTTEDPDKQLLLDKRQLALKLTCNAVYGFTGVGNGMLPCIPVAESVTAIGRKMLNDTRNYIDRILSDRECLEKLLSVRSDMGFRMTVIYGDTDSCFVMIEGMDIENLRKLLPLMADHITRTLFKPPVKLEVDKLFTKLLLLCKKRYVGVLDQKTTLSMKGVDLVRRNVCEFVKKKTMDVFESLFFDTEVSEAAQKLSVMDIKTFQTSGPPTGFMKIISLLSAAHAELHENKVKMDDLILSSTLSQPCDAYKQTNLPHLAVVKKKLLRKEDIPVVGDRVFYVLVESKSVGKGKGSANYEIAECPEYAKQHNLKINADKYFSQLIKTVSNSLGSVFPLGVNAEKYFTTSVPKKLYLPYNIRKFCYVIKNAKHTENS